MLGGERARGARCRCNEWFGFDGFTTDVQGRSFKATSGIDSKISLSPLDGAGRLVVAGLADDPMAGLTISRPLGPGTLSVLTFGFRGSSGKRSVEVNHLAPIDLLVATWGCGRRADLEARINVEMGRETVVDVDVDVDNDNVGRTNRSAMVVRVFGRLVDRSQSLLGACSATTTRTSLSL